MASILKVDAMQGVTSAGDITITSEGGAATQSLQQGLAKAWCHFEGSDATLDGTFNVGSLTDNGAGNFDINFSSSMSDANFSASTTANISITGVTECKCQTYTTSSVRIHQISNGGHVDCNDTVGTVHGDLA